MNKIIDLFQSKRKGQNYNEDLMKLSARDIISKEFPVIGNDQLNSDDNILFSRVGLFVGIPFMAYAFYYFFSRKMLLPSESTIFLTVTFSICWGLFLLDTHLRYRRRVLRDKDSTDD